MNDKERFDRFTERARKVLRLAQEEAQRFNHNYIGTEHLLLGLIREGDGVAANVLGNLRSAGAFLDVVVSREACGQAPVDRWPWLRRGDSRQHIDLRGCRSRRHLQG